MDWLAKIVVSIWSVAADMAFFLLLGFLVAGVLSVFISPVWLERHLGRPGMGSVFKASLFGVPLPLCSCGVIPVAASLRRHGASRAATTAFLLSTPQTGIDSIAVTYTMLGPLLAIYRPVAALLTGILGGGLVQALAPGEGNTHRQEDPFAPAPAGHPEAAPRGLAARIRAALDYGLVTLPGDIARPLLVGVLIAGALAALVPQDFLAGYLGRGPLSIALMMIVGIPLYVCATASVPLAAGFIFLGASPGAALAFLVAGPATNAATLTTIGRVLGRRVLVIFLLTVAGSAFLGGVLMDWLMPRMADTLPVLSGLKHHHEGTSWPDHLWALVLTVVMIRSWWLGRRRAAGCGCGDGGKKGSCAMSNDAGQSLEFTVTGMSCSHCSGSVDRALRELPGVAEVQVRLDAGRVTVRGQGLDAGVIIRTITALGYQAAQVS